MELNNPDVRLGILRERIAIGASLVAQDLATEFGVSLDTIRRDLIALELAGTAKRVRGGAVPMIQPSGRCAIAPGRTSLSPTGLPSALFKDYEELEHYSLMAEQHALHLQKYCRPPPA